MHDEEHVRSQTKQRLFNLLKAGVGGIVVAAASLTASRAEATSVPAAVQAALDQRVKELRQQLSPGQQLGGVAERALGWYNWGNHWPNWHNWHNWANWHNW